MARKACVDGADFMSRERRALEEAAHLYETRRERHDPSYVFRAASGERGRPTQ